MLHKGSVTFFKKLDARQKVHLPDGRWLSFFDTGNGWGVLATGNVYEVQQLRECISRARGGIEEITHEQYEEVKKKREPILFGAHFREQIEIRRLSRILRQIASGKDVVEDKERFHSDVGYRAERIGASPKGTNGFRPKAVAREAWAKSGRA